MNLLWPVVLLLLKLNLIKVALSHCCCRTTLQSHRVMLNKRKWFLKQVGFQFPPKWDDWRSSPVSWRQRVPSPSCSYRKKRYCNSWSVWRCQPLPHWNEYSMLLHSWLPRNHVGPALQDYTGSLFFTASSSRSLCWCSWLTVIYVRRCLAYIREV